MGQEMEAQVQLPLHTAPELRESERKISVGERRYRWVKEDIGGWGGRSMDHTTLQIKKRGEHIPANQRPYVNEVSLTIRNLSWSDLNRRRNLWSDWTGWLSNGCSKCMKQHSLLQTFPPELTNCVIVEVAVLGSRP